MDRVIYEAQEENLIFTSSPARVCQGNYEDETFFDHLHLCPDVHESQEDEQVAKADDEPNEM